MAARKRKRGGLNIQIAKKNQGALHRTAGVPRKKKIPVSTLARLKKSKNPLTRRRATFAMNARSWGHR